MAQPITDAQPKALKPALEPMTLLVAAVIVHDEATYRVVPLQRSDQAKLAKGRWDLPVGKSEPGEPITATAVLSCTKRLWSGEPENREPQRHVQVRWVDANALPEELVETTASTLHRYLADGPQVSMVGWN